MHNNVGTAVLALLDYCRREGWAGYDPSDALNSRLSHFAPFRYSTHCRLVLIQFLKRLPFNLRPLLLISKEQNPEALALFLTAGLRLSKLGIPGTDGIAGEMVRRLEALRSKGTTYWCWGCSFPWQTRPVIVPRGKPNLVCTAFVADALLDAYERTRKSRLLDMANSAGQYILKELYWTDQDGTASFSYPLQGMRTRAHNANFLAAALLCRLYRHTGYRQTLEPALRVVRSSAARQREDGSWDYGEDSTLDGADNFHTGYNLCALRAISRDAGTSEFDAIIHRGFEYYRRQFFRDDGAPKRMHNLTYPIDIRCVAQGIITLLAFRDIEEINFDLAHIVTDWALENMWDGEGYFYYQVQPFYKNRISYMYWSQAWMLLALSTLLEQSRKAALP